MNINMNMNINKWLITLFVTLLLILIIQTNIINTENLESISNGNTLRNIDDYVTVKDSEKINKLIYLKCNIANKEYYLGNINISKINDNCDLCENSQLKNKILVLCNSELKQKYNCIEDASNKCYNDPKILNCQEYIDNECKKNKINADNFLFAIELLDQDTKKFSISVKNTNTIEKYGLSLLEENNNKNKNKNIIDMLKAIYFLNIPIIKTSSIVCCDKYNVNLTNKQELYFDDENLTKDKIKFKIYFLIDGKKKYIGYNAKNICCKENDKECKQNYFALTVFDKAEHENVLIFEPEIVDIINV
jgi:hypothetical protein